MKQKGIVVLAILCCLLCLSALLVYVYPWGTQRVEWSLLSDGNDEPSRSDADWTVYVMRDGARIPLEPLGLGRYAGCEPGETFYRSREWDATLQSPVLRVYAVNAAIAVWIDDTLCYSDAPLTDEEIGEARLPMLGGDRSGAVEIAMNQAVYGHTLTIAQASPTKSETPGYARVYPCDVEVVSAYGYERGVISSAYREGLFAALLCAVGILLCVLACKSADPSILLLALLVFARLSGVILGVSFFGRYMNVFGIDPAICADQLSFSIMLGFLALKCTRGKAVMGGLAIVHAMATLLALALDMLKRVDDASLFFRFLPDKLTVCFLIALLALSVWQLREKNDFYRQFVKWFALFFSAWLATEIVYLLLHPNTLNAFLRGQMDYAVFFRVPCVWVTQAAGILAVVIDAVRRLIAAREERVFAAIRVHALQQSYDNLKQHHSEVLALRHEMKHHYVALKGFVDGGQLARASDYLHELLQKQEQVAQVVHTENDVINIIMGSRIAMAKNANIRVEIRRMNAPGNLPLSDHDVVSLFMNIIDNAVDAARQTRNRPGFIQLDLRCKNGFLVFTCENSMPSPDVQNQKSDSDLHGQGLLIIKKILAPIDGLMTTRIENDCYVVTIVLPLSPLPPANNRSSADTVTRSGIL